MLPVFLFILIDACIVLLLAFGRYHDHAFLILMKSACIVSLNSLRQLHVTHVSVSSDSCRL